MKVTADWTEAAAWAAMNETGKRFPGVAKTPIVGALRLGSELAATWILQERLFELTKDEREFVNRINTDLAILSGVMPWFPQDRSRIVVRTIADRDLPNGGAKRVKALVASLLALDKLGIRTADLHGNGNLLKRADSTIVVADFGVADAPSGWIPSLDA